MIRRARRDGREAGGNEEREKREDRERDQRGDRERESKRQIEEKEGLRDPPLLEFLDPTLCCSHCVSSSPQGMTSWSSTIKICFYKLIESIILKICHGVEQNAKKMCHW